MDLKHHWSCRVKERSPTVVDVTDAVEIALSIFVKQILSPRSDYFHGVVWIEEAT